MIEQHLLLIFSLPGFGFVSFWVHLFGFGGFYWVTFSGTIHVFYNLAVGLAATSIKKKSDGWRMISAANQEVCLRPVWLFMWTVADSFLVMTLTQNDCPSWLTGSEHRPYMCVHSRVFQPFLEDPNTDGPDVPHPSTVLTVSSQLEHLHREATRGRSD